MYDFTVAITAHSETIVAGPTMRSAEAAIRAAETCGLKVERVIGLDAASSACRRFFSQPIFAGWTVLDLNERDLGLARNLLAESASGRWMAFLDSDDLFSENWLFLTARELARAEQHGAKVILHPELNWFFDAAKSVLVNPDASDPLVSPHYWYVANYYDSLVAAPREAFLNVPYAGRNHEKGFGYEDWRWNLETTVAGWRHAIVKDTIIFKRRQDTSMVTELSKTRSLLWDMDIMAIDRIMEKS